jgi:hypothetical protein
MKKTQKQLNAEFLSLPPSEQRIAIARDTIIQVLTKQYTVAQGFYFQVSRKNPRVRNGADLQKLLTGPDPIPCHVCARGAMFASAVRMGNGVYVSHSDYTELSGKGKVVEMSPGSPAFRQKEEVPFSLYQRKLIECAFERDGDFAGWIVSPEDTCAALDFGDKYSSESQRLVAIMQNLIENNGEFKPRVGVKNMPTLRSLKTKNHA